MKPLELSLVSTQMTEHFRLEGFGFAARPTGRNADFSRIVEVGGRRQTLDSNNWVSTNARLARILPAALPTPAPTESGEDWLVQIAESEEDLRRAPFWGSCKFTQGIASGAAVPTAAPTDGLTPTEGYPVTPSWVSGRAFFHGLVAQAITQWVWSRISGRWEPFGQGALVAAITLGEDLIELVPDGRIYFQSSAPGVTLDLYATKQF